VLSPFGVFVFQRCEGCLSANGYFCFAMLQGKDPQRLHDYEVNYVPIIVFIGRDGLIRHIYHHYILPEELDARVRKIVEASHADVAPATAGGR